ncbi:DUF5133 domain-containing protein [Streptomyces sp. NPDC001340]
MPLIDYAVLRHLLSELDELMQPPHGTSPDTVQRLEDLQYTMCVYTGVRDPREAVAEARSLLSTVEPRKA